MNTSTTPPSAKPWYRHFWVWFILALPAAVVVAGLTTVFIAVINQDSVVRDDWYKDGKAINQSLARDSTATRLGVGAQIVIDELTGDVTVTLQQTAQAPLPSTLNLVFSHPTQASADQTVPLALREGKYRGHLRQALQGRFQIELGNAEWRLLGEREFPQAEFSLTHD